MTVLVDLWCDGSGTVAGQPGGWAYVLVATHPTTGEIIEREGSGGVADATNNRMELMALIQGLRALKRPSMVVVHSDSQYVLEPLRTGYILDWSNRGWKKATGGKVKNSDLWKRLLHEAGKHIITYEHVKGHSGVKYNERCDVLAGQERRRLLAS